VAKSDFGERLGRLAPSGGDRQGSVAPGRVAKDRSLPAPAVIGVLWGSALGLAAGVLNGNYETLFRSEGALAGAPGWATFGLAFLLASLLLAVIPASGPLPAVIGRFSRRRGGPLAMAVAGIGTGGLLSPAPDMTGVIAGGSLG
jgi:hypothetical protein